MPGGLNFGLFPNQANGGQAMPGQQEMMNQMMGQMFPASMMAPMATPQVTTQAKTNN